MKNQIVTFAFLDSETVLSCHTLEKREGPNIIKREVQPTPLAIHSIFRRYEKRQIILLLTRINCPITLTVREN